MNVYLYSPQYPEGVEVFVDGDQAPAFTLSLSDLLDPSSIRGTRSSTIRILNTPESRKVLGSEAMMWNTAGPFTIAFKDDGADVFTSQLVILRVDRNIYETMAIGGNAMWFEWAKKTKLQEMKWGNSDIINSDVIAATWTDPDSLLYFPLINTGSILQRPSTYDVPPEKLRPCVRVHSVLDRAFAEVGYRIQTHGSLTPAWKKYAVFHPTDELSREIPNPYLVYSYVSGPTAWQDGSGPFFLPPTNTNNGTVQLTDYLVGFDPFEYAFDDAVFSIIVYDFTDQVVLAELVLPPVEVGGTLSVNHLFTGLKFIAGHQIATAVQMFDMPEPLTIDTGGPVTLVSYSDGTDTLVLQSPVVQPVDLTDADTKGPFIMGTRMAIASVMPKMSVMDLFKALINAQRLVVETDPDTRTIDVYFEVEYLRKLTPGVEKRTLTDRIDHTLAPSKLIDQQPVAMLLKWKEDKGDHYLLKANKIIGGTVGYANGLADIPRGTKQQTTIELPFAATAMGKVFAGLLVPTMIKEGGELQVDAYDFEDRMLIDGGMRPGTWKYDGDSLTEYPYAYFANDTPAGPMLAFDNAAIYGDTRQGVMFTLWADRLATMRESRAFEANTFWNDHEIPDFDFGMPTIIHDGHAECAFYVQEIKDHRFGRTGPTRTVYIEIPQPEMPVAPVITYCAGGIRVSGSGSPEADGIYCPDDTENGANVWTKVGGTRLADSIYMPLFEGEPLGYYLLTSGGTFEDDPLNALYSTAGAPGDYTWYVYDVFGGGGDTPAPSVVLL